MIKKNYGCSGCAYNEKSADEMFEELGYKKICNKPKQNFHIEYTKYDDYLNKTIIIQFWCDKSIDKINGNDEAEFIDMQELQAINKKVKELGWL